MNTETNLLETSDLEAALEEMAVFTILRLCPISQAPCGFHAPECADGNPCWVKS